MTGKYVTVIVKHSTKRTNVVGEIEHGILIKFASNMMFIQRRRVSDRSHALSLQLSLSAAKNGAPRATPADSLDRSREEK